jgi:hypothetical protein
MSTIDAMRSKVNKMKHASSLSERCMTSHTDYDVAAQAIEDFWAELERQMVFVSVECGPHTERYLEA